MLSPPLTGLGFETIQFAPKFGGRSVGAQQLVTAAAAAGFSWLAFDRHTLAIEAQDPDGLAAVAAACARALCPCRVIQSLRLVNDRADTALGFARLRSYVQALNPDVVPLILLAEPTRGVVDQLRSMIGELLDRHPALRLGLEFGSIFPVADLLSARRLIDSLNEERIGLVLDSWHLFTVPPDWTGLHALTDAEIVLVQLNDHSPHAEVSLDVAKNQRLLPGEGSLPLSRFVDLLGELSYSGLISAEVISSELRHRTPEAFAKAAYDATAALWA